MKFRLVIHLMLLAAVLLPASGAGAVEEQPTVASVLARIERADPTLQTFRARVEFSVGLHSFPYVKKTVHGQTYFKRPDKMEIVFEDMPGYASRFKNVFIGLGTPADWERKFEIALVSAPGVCEGCRLLLTPRNHDRRLRDVLVTLDPQSMLPTRMLWRYNDGEIALDTTYAHVEDHVVVAVQRAEAHFPLWRGWAQSQLSAYSFNVPIDDALFTPKKNSD